MENKIPSPAAVAGRIKPKPVQPVMDQQAGWHAVPATDLKADDIVRMRLGGHGPTYRVDKIEGDTVHLSVYSTVGIGKVPPRTVARDVTRMWKWF